MHSFNFNGDMTLTQDLMLKKTSKYVIFVNFISLPPSQVEKYGINCGQKNAFDLSMRLLSLTWFELFKLRLEYYRFKNDQHFQSIFQTFVQDCIYI